MILRFCIEHGWSWLWVLLPVWFGLLFLLILLVKKL